MRTIGCLATAAALLGLSGPVSAQSSTSYQIEQLSFGAAGIPVRGAAPESTSYSMTLASFGDTVVAEGLTSAGYSVGVGSNTASHPPGEVAATCGSDGGGCVSFLDTQVLVWPAERSAGFYNLYRDSMSGLVGSGFGQCVQQGVIGTSWTDNAQVPAADGFFYLVTVVNRLGEEGTKGFAIDGGAAIERGGTVCP